MIKELQNLNEIFSKLNFKYKIISSKHIIELKQEIDQLYIDKKISKKIYHYISKYYDFKNFNITFNNRYVIIIAIPQKISFITLKIKGKKYDVIIPPTYIYKKNQKKIYRTLVNIFKEVNYAYLPKKLIAVRSGLAKYGKNNICYVDGMGSLHRLESFYIHFRFGIDNWKEKILMDECHNCTLCIKACPNNCIREQDFVIKAENCLTFFNENLKVFPKWIDNKSHNALIGCMICQNICPINKKYKKTKIKVLSFTERESEIICQHLNLSNLPLGLKGKLKRINMDEYISVLSRNINVLI